MADKATWWDEPGAGGGSPVKRHAPDTHNYHVPDPAQVEKMRGSRVGAFAVVPAANNDGTSKGFDPTVAGPVHVDPDAPDGGVVFDPATVRKGDLDRAVAGSYYPHQAFYQLGRPAPALGLGTAKQAATAAAQAAENPHMPGVYVTPHDGAYYTPPPPAQEERHMTPAPVHPQAAPPQVPYQPPVAYVAPPAYAVPPPDPALAALMQGMAQLQQTVAGLVQHTTRPPTTGISPVPMPVGRPAGLSTQPVELQAQPPARRRPPADFEDDARPIRRTVRRPRGGDEETDADDNRSLVRRAAAQDEPPTTLREYEQSQVEPEGVIVGFEALNIKFVTGPLPHKPKRQVVFDIPGVGKHRTWYHDVIDSPACVVLVYDTRHDGSQFAPNELDEKSVITMHVSGGRGKEDQVYRVVSLGLSFPFGVFDHIVMVKAHEDGVDYGRDE